jgi:hypothetical protein
MERRADENGGPKAAIHSGLASALGFHPWRALIVAPKERC